jgi:hypothetical protein
MEEEICGAKRDIKFQVEGGHVDIVCGLPKKHSGNHLAWVAFR